MFRILIIAEEDNSSEKLHLELSQKGYSCSIASKEAEIGDIFAGETPDAVLVESKSHSQMKELARKIKQESNMPVIALVEKEMLASVNGYLDLIDDFVIKPYDPMELSLRVERLIRKTRGVDSSEQLNCGDLIIDLAKYEVFVNNTPVMLTFKEYELLRFLASNAGRVFTREALLNKVWGYDYYGGDRTVDVHITRLRSKIVNSSHTFIDTVRNIGYRLRVDT